MRRPTRTIVLALLAASLPLTPAWAAGRYRVIVNPSNPASTLGRADVARLFLKKVTSWADGRPVAAVDQQRTSPVREAFSAEIHQKDADAIAAHWQVLVFSGRDVPPRILKSDAEVLDFVRSNPGAIGYVSDGVALEGVKALTVR